MAAIYDAASGINCSSSQVSSISWSHTCTGNDRVLIVSVFQGSGSGSGGDDVVTGITYNGTSMTRAAVRQQSGDGAVIVYVYYLYAPATGANTIAVSASANRYLGGCAISFTNVTSSPIGNNGAGGGNSGTITANITTAADNSIIVNSKAESGGGGAYNPGSGETYRVSQGYDGPGGAEGGMSTKPTTTAGAYSVSWGGGASGSLACIALEIKGLADPTPETVSYIPKTIMIM